MDSGSYDIGLDGRKWHDFTIQDTGLLFEDTIIVSDEVVPPSEKDGKSYTLWTEAHEQNQLSINGQKGMPLLLILQVILQFLIIFSPVDVQQIPFEWDITMSRKRDTDGNLAGSFDIDDVEIVFMPNLVRKGRRRQRRRRLEYEPVWNITETQIKLGIRPIFPTQIGEPTIQLARQSCENSKKVSEGLVSLETKSNELIEISDDEEPAVPAESVEDILGESGARLVEALAMEKGMEMGVC